jgi:CRISPR-associated endonuclease/helicase Cas3
MQRRETDWRVKMQISDYAHFFEAIHGKKPFPWQERLAARVLQYGWGSSDDPDNRTQGRTDLLALPTACGKTSVIDTAVFHLAFQLATNAQPRTAPLRIFFVIDRRIVVDESHARARRIAAALRNATGGILKETADALRRIGALSSGDDPLHVAVMRGGMYRDDGWARSPVQPTVCASTVDQVGSRLLFRGYGISEFQRPIHAGLIGCDSLIVLDEAHISNPFLETLRAVQRFAGPDWFEARPPVHRPLQVVQMTATPRPGTKTFTISQADRDDAVLNARLTTSKPAQLVEVKTKATPHKMNSSERRQVEAENDCLFVERIVQDALRLAGLQATDSAEAAAPSRRRRASSAELPIAVRTPPPVRVVGVVVNRVATARRVFEALRELRGPAGGLACHAILLTGRIRPYDRDELLYRVPVNGDPTGWLRYIRADRTDTDQLALPLFVVATQTIEVGADLSFDALITEIASLDALRQRFGRLDRLGHRQLSRAVVVARTDSIARNAGTDPVYGDSLPYCWRQLEQWATTQGRGRNRIKVIDFGIDALGPKVELLQQQSPSEFTAIGSPVQHSPVILPAHVDSWCQTSPKPAADPDVALFLHGPVSGPADVQIVWRADLPVRLVPNQLEGYIVTVNLVPPTSLEAIPLPVYQVRPWLLAKAGNGLLTDVEGAATDEETMAASGSSEQSRNPLVLRWCGPQDPRTRLITADDIRPGDTIVVSADLGGCDPYGWNPACSALVRDVADPAARVARWRPVLRLHESLLRGWFWPNPSSDAVHSAFARRMAAKWRLDEVDETESPDFDAVLESLRDDPDTPAWARQVASELLGGRNRRRPEAYPEDSGWLLERRRRLTRQQITSQEVDLQSRTEQDSGGDESWMTGCEVKLAAHCEAVRCRAEFFARAVGLPAAACQDLMQAAWLHDVGKADPRFQVWLHDGDEVAAAAAPALLGKSRQSGRNAAAILRARERAGYPAGGRHECLSVALIANSSGVVSTERDAAIVRYLVGTHHGRGRPFMPVVSDHTSEQAEICHGGTPLRGPCDHRLYGLSSGWADLFWRMIRQHGYWSLAFLEAVLRLADQTISEEEQQQE